MQVEADHDGVVESGISDSEVTLDDIYDDSEQDDLNYPDIIGEFFLYQKDIWGMIDFLPSREIITSRS